MNRDGAMTRGSSPRRSLVAVAKSERVLVHVDDGTNQLLVGDEQEKWSLKNAQGAHRRRPCNLTGRSCRSDSNQGFGPR